MTLVTNNYKVLLHACGLDVLRLASGITSLSKFGREED